MDSSAWDDAACANTVAGDIRVGGMVGGLANDIFCFIIVSRTYLPKYPVWTHMSTCLGGGEDNKSREIFGE